MTKPMVRIHDLEMDEIIDREMTDEEFAKYEESVASAKAAEDARIAAKAKKELILEKLGLSQEDLEALLG